MAKETVKKRIKEVNSPEPKYSKSDILKSDNFSKIERDFLSAYLPDGDHTIVEAKSILEKIRKGAVN